MRHQIIFLVLITFATGLAIDNSSYILPSSREFVEHLQGYLDSPASRLSPKCNLHLGFLLSSLVPPKKWAWKMLDAASKPLPSGILEFNMVDFGSFDECLSAEGDVLTSKIYGKYCLGHMEISIPSPDVQNQMIGSELTVAITFAACLPHSCSAGDFEDVYKFLRTARFEENRCSSKIDEVTFSTGDIAVITFFSATAAIVLLSTAYDTFLFYRKRKPLHPLLVSFSILTNGRKLFTVSSSSGQISCLHGLRVVSMMWIIYGHRFGATSAYPKVNQNTLNKWIENRWNMYLMSTTLSVDTFFVLGGLLVSYLFMSAVTNGIKFNIAMFYVHRYFRLTPLVAVAILIHVSIFKYLGDGPIWYQSVQIAEAGCAEYWWTNLLYVQNYVNPSKICLGQSWYLAVDTQLYILSPLILLWLPKRPAIGLGIAALATLLSMLGCFLTAWFYELRTVSAFNPNIDAFNAYYYNSTHTRASVWLIGLLLGYVLFKLKQRRISLNKSLVLLLWIITLALFAGLIFGKHETFETVVSYSRVGTSLFITFQRPLWALALCWVIFACFTGYGGPINWFLSAPLFEVLSRLTYSMYLIHLAVLAAVTGQMRVPNFFGNFEMVYAFGGDYLFTIGVAIVLTLAFESPIIAIVSSLLKKPRRNDDKLEQQGVEQKAENA